MLGVIIVKKSISWLREEINCGQRKDGNDRKQVHDSYLARKIDHS